MDAKVDDHRSQVDALTAWALDGFVAKLQHLDVPTVWKVLLYGSRARGDARDDSDIDIAVVFRGEAPASYPLELLWQLTDLGSDIFIESDCRAYLSPRPFFEVQLENPGNTANPLFYENVVKDGLQWGSPHG